MAKKIKHWKTLSSKVLLDHPRLKITEDTVELPDGKTWQYVREAPKKHDSVAVIALNDKGEVLIQQEYSYPPDKVMWQLPGGGMENGEDEMASARRELAEESGYGAKNVVIIGKFFTNNRRSDQTQFVALCTGLYPYKLQEDAQEFIETYWMPRSEIEHKIKRGEFDNINLLAALNIWFHTG